MPIGPNKGEVLAPYILITRPEPGASQTATKLERAGIKAKIMSFTEMVAKQYVLPDDEARNVSAIVVTSANAIRHLKDETVRKFVAIPIFAVGNATADAARVAGFINVMSADGDARDLCQMVISQVPSVATVLYFCGVTRTDDLEEGLRSDAFRLKVVEVYATKKASQLTYKFRNLFAHTEPQAIAFYSSVSARLFSDIVSNSSAADVTGIKQFFCISERARSALPENFRARTLVSSHPSDDAMIELVKSHF